MYVVSRIIFVIAKGAKDILRVVFRWRDIVSQLRVSIWLVGFLKFFPLLGMAIKPLPVKGQTGTFKPSVTLSNLVPCVTLVR